MNLDTLQRDLLNDMDANSREFKDNEAYYLAQRRPEAIGLAVPREMQKLLANVGYVRLYLDSLANRIELEGFRTPEKEADELLWEWWTTNRMDVQFILGVTEALVQGRAYLTVSAPDPNNPRLDKTIPIQKAESPLSVYADIDPWTHEVRTGIRIHKNRDGEVDRTVLYLPDRTVYRVLEDGKWIEDPRFPEVHHNLGIVPIVPLMNRTKLSDQLGTSEITPELKSTTDAASRILMDMQGGAELLALPQRILFGVEPDEFTDENGDAVDSFTQYMAGILTVSAPEGKAMEFSSADLQNFATALAEIRKEVEAYTGLPASYLAQSAENPPSAEAIIATNERLVKKAERKCTVFGDAVEEFQRVSWMVMNPGKDLPKEYNRLEAIWRDPNTPTYAAKADGASKLYANGTGIIPKERARIDLGYTVIERQQMKEWDKEEQQESLDLMKMYADAAPEQEEPNDTASAGDRNESGSVRGAGGSGDSSGSGARKPVR